MSELNAETQSPECASPCVGQSRLCPGGKINTHKFCKQLQEGVFILEAHCYRRFFGVLVFPSSFVLVLLSNRTHSSLESLVKKHTLVCSSTAIMNKHGKSKGMGLRNWKYATDPRQPPYALIHARNRRGKKGASRWSYIVDL